MSHTRSHFSHPKLPFGSTSPKTVSAPMHFLPRSRAYDEKPPLLFLPVHAVELRRYRLEDHTEGGVFV